MLNGSLEPLGGQGITGTGNGEQVAGMERDVQPEPARVRLRDGEVHRIEIKPVRKQIGDAEAFRPLPQFVPQGAVSDERQISIDAVRPEILPGEPLPPEVRPRARRDVAGALTRPPLTSS